MKPYSYNNEGLYFQNEKFIHEDIMEAIKKCGPIVIHLFGIAKVLIISPRQYFYIKHVAISLLF